MLVQAEFYQVGSRVICDVICERCGETAVKDVPLAVVSKLVCECTPVICSDCHELRCRKCGKFPQGDTRQNWPNGVCWDCRDKFIEEIARKLFDYPVAISE